MGYDVRDRGQTSKRANGGRVADLFCGAGGAGMGLHRAGFEVVGFDIEPQANYPFEFHQADALGVDLSEFDAVWASPPCQAYSFATQFHPEAIKVHPKLIEPTREVLLKTELPYVIENVPGAPIRRDATLCGEMFGLRIHRHRYFETNILVMSPKHGKHQLKGAKHNCHIEKGVARIVAGHYSGFSDACEVMGIEWMGREELAQAVPPAYAEFIGKQLMAHIRATVPRKA